MPPSIATTEKEYCWAVSKSRFWATVSIPVDELIIKVSGALIKLYSTVPADSASPSTATNSPSTVPIMADSRIWNWNGPLGNVGVTSFTSSTSISTVAEANWPGELVAKTPNLYSLISSLSSGRSTEIHPLCESMENGSSSLSPLSSSK